MSLLRISRLLVVILLLPTALAAQTVETVREADKGVFRIVAPNGGTGTGYLINDQGYVVTNNHVVGDHDEVYVLKQQANGNEIIKAEVLRKDSDLDMAVIRARGLSGEPLSFNPSGAVKGLKVFALGFPGIADTENPSNVDEFLQVVRNSRNFTTSSHTVGDISRIVQDTWSSGRRQLDIIQHTAPIRPGNSGGPLMDVCGRVVGMNTAGISDRSGTGASTVYLASASKEIVAFLNNANVRFDRQSTPCDPTGAAAPVTAPVPAAEQDMTLPLIIVGVALVLLAGIGAFFVVRKRARLDVAEDARAELSRRLRALEGNGGPKTSPTAPPSPTNVPGPPPSVPGEIAWRVKFWGDAGKIGFRFAEASPSKPLTIGRDRASVDLHLNESGISRQHARLTAKGGRLHIEDLRSTNGTYINDRKIDAGASAEVQSGDRLNLGKIKGTVERE